MSCRAGPTSQLRYISQFIARCTPREKEHTPPSAPVQYLTCGTLRLAYEFILFAAATATAATAQWHRIAAIGQNHIRFHPNSRITLRRDLRDCAVHPN